MKQYKAMKYVAVASLMGLAFILSASSPVQASSGRKPMEQKAVSTRAKKGSGATDANIKKTEATNNPALAGKTAPRGRGSGPFACTVYIYNHTLLYSKVYVDGDYVGMVGPAGVLWVRTGNGPTTAYVRADFDNGTFHYWGPNSFDCEGSYNWHLYP